MERVYGVVCKVIYEGAYERVYEGTYKGVYEGAYERVYEGPSSGLLQSSLCLVSSLRQW